jgi:hypothetical protein
MENTAKYEYRVSTIDDSPVKVDIEMKYWAENGWELVSGGASSWASRDSGYSSQTTWHTKFVMYWRKPIPSEPETPSV